MTDELHPPPDDAMPDELTELADDPMIARMRSALDEAARIEPGTAKPAAAPDRRRWVAVAAAAVLVIGGVAALAVNMSRDHSTVAGPVPAPGTSLTGQAIIIDMGEGPRMAVTLMTSLPPQGGDIPLTGFDWSMIDDEETVSGTTWTDTFQQITGTWDGITFTLTQPPAPAVTSVSTSTPIDQTCPDSSAQAAADAISALDVTALHLTEWYPQAREGVCGVHVGAWFDTQELRDALDGVRSAGHEVQAQYVFNPVPTDTPDTTTPHSDSVPSSEDLDLNWFVLDLPGFTSQPDRKEVCCPPLPAPGPATTIAWGDVGGLDQGVLLLTVTPKVEGEPQLDYSWAAMTDERAGQLIGEVVPGSGLPYVLPSQSMQFLGTGLAGYGDLRGQIWANGQGTVDITVGDYRGQLDVLTTGSIEATTIAGQAATRVRRSGGDAVVWQTPDGRWATVTIDDRGLTDREDEIFAAIEPAPRPSEPTDTTTVDSTPTSTITVPGDDLVYVGNVGGIIDNGDGRGPMLTFGFLDSLPPQGGSLPLANFDWSMIDGEATERGVTWYPGAVGLTGTFDGTTFTLIEPPSTPFTFADDALTYNALTPGCTLETMGPMLEQLGTLDYEALSLIESSDYAWDGHCGVQVRAMFDSPELREAVATVGDDVTVRIVFRPVQP